MQKVIDDLLQLPYWIIDILPEQVPKDGLGQYFAVEKRLQGQDCPRYFDWRQDRGRIKLSLPFISEKTWREQ